MRITGLTTFVLLLGVLQHVSAESKTSEPAFPPKGYFSGNPLPPGTIYLTFDDGPAPATSQILDILKEKGVHATFFLNAFDRKQPAKDIASSNRFIAYKDVLKRMIAEGHVLGNHTFSHRDLATLSASQMNWQLDKVQQCLDQALGTDAPRLTLVRPPFGSPWMGRWNTDDQRRKVAAVMEARGAVVINWTDAWDSSDSVDWVVGESQRLNGATFVPTMQYTSKQNRELKRLLAHADGTASAIILFHDTHPTVLDVLGQVIDQYKAMGYRFATLDEYVSWRWGPTETVDSAPVPAPDTLQTAAKP
jgi:peptidoglycan/xylan/chitin deacetylase (PgdA/CDA1 family)